jgi:hypothetical protein
LNFVVPESAIRQASAYGCRNAAIGLPPPGPYVPRPGSLDALEAERLALVKQPRPEKQRPSIARKANLPSPRKSRAKPKVLQEAAA